LAAESSARPLDLSHVRETFVVSVPIAWENILKPITYEQNREEKAETNFCQYRPGVSFLEAPLHAWTSAKNSQWLTDKSKLCYTSNPLTEITWQRNANYQYWESIDWNNIIVTHLVLNSIQVNDFVKEFHCIFIKSQ
jgi:hypothetical protein